MEKLKTKNSKGRKKNYSKSWNKKEGKFLYSNKKMKYFNSNFIIPILKLGMNGLSSKRVGCIGHELDHPVY